MGTDYQRGRADAAAGKYNPPEPSLIFDWGKDYDTKLERKEEYREGYHDKRNELEDEE